MRTRLPLATSLLYLSVCLTAAVWGAVPPSVPATTFTGEVTAHFASWDRDHDGIFSPAEIDTAVADSKVTGDEAAAIAAIKRAIRSKLYQLPPLTQQSLLDLAGAKPAAGNPNLPAMYKAACGRMSADRAALLPAGKPKLESISQGKLGDCFCLAPLGAMLARSPEEVAALFQRQPDSTYRVKLGLQSISVAAPTDAEIALSASTRQTGMWVNLYEKAVGTTRIKTPAASAMDALGRGGSAGTMLSTLTGHRIVRFSCSFAKSDKTTPEEREAKLSELRKLLTEAQKERRLMTCGTSKTKTPGITPNHAYAVLSYDAKADTAELWNPHGDNFAPKGPAGLQYGYPRKSGVFSLPLSDLVDQFAGLAFEMTETALPSDPVNAPNAPGQS